MSEQDSQEVCDSSIEASDTGTARTPGPPAASSLTVPRTVSSEAAAATTLYRKQRQPIQYLRGELPTDDRNSRYPQRARGLLGSSPRHYLGVHSTSTSSRSQRQHSWTLQQHSPIWGLTLHRISTSTTSPREGIQPATAPLGSNPAIAPAKIRPKQPTVQHRQHNTALPRHPTLHRTALPRRPTNHLPLHRTAPNSSSSTTHTAPLFFDGPHPRLLLHRPAQPARSPPPTGHPSLPIHPGFPQFPLPPNPNPQTQSKPPGSHHPPGPQPSRPLP